MDQEPSPAYTHVGRCRVRAKRDRGSRIELDDRSHWEVPAGHEIFTRHWVTEAEVTVVPGDFSGYPYDLINLESGERVPARYLGDFDVSLGWSLVDE